MHGVQIGNCYKDLRNFTNSQSQFFFFDHVTLIIVKGQTHISQTLFPCQKMKNAKNNFVGFISREIFNPENTAVPVQLL